MEEIKDNIILYYDDFIVAGKDNKYYVRDAKVDSEWHEVRLVARLTEKEIEEAKLTDNDLYTYFDADYTGEELYGTDYLYFKRIKGE